MRLISNLSVPGELYPSNLARISVAMMVSPGAIVTGCFMNSWGTGMVRTRATDDSMDLTGAHYLAYR